MRGLGVDVRVPRGALTIEAAFTAEPGEVVALVGPNGAGKSSVLAAISGSADADGEVEVDGERWDRMPSHRRRVGVAHQDHALFPHLSVVDNVAFARRARGARRRAARADVQPLLADFDLIDLADRRPDQLSGGQSQRTALARAFAGDPRVLLLDEPFAAVDVATAQRLRGLLRARLAEFTGVTVLVTHDPVDVFTLADRVVVLENGRLVADGTPTGIAERPPTAHAARLMGRNVLAGTSDGTAVALDAGGELHTATPEHGRVLVSFRPASITLYGGDPGGSARNRWRTQVAAVLPSGEVTRIHLEAPDILAEVTPEAVRELGLAEGTPVWAALKATDIDVLPGGPAR